MIENENSFLKLSNDTQAKGFKLIIPSASTALPLDNSLQHSPQQNTPGGTALISGLVSLSSRKTREENDLDSTNMIYLDGINVISKMYPSYISRPLMSTLPNLVSKRIERIEALIKRMTSPNSSLHFTNRAKSSSFSCPSSEIISWLILNDAYFSRLEAMTTMQTMLEYGYLIYCDTSDKIRDDDSLVTMQAPNMWCTDWSPSEGGEVNT
jgi:hypothetical protein